MNAMPKVDVCIVGAGAGGATAAMRLAEARLSVVVLEAGPHWDPAKDFVNDPEVMAKKFHWDMPVTYAGDPEADSVIGVRGHGWIPESEAAPTTGPVRWVDFILPTSRRKVLTVWGPIGLSAMPIWSPTIS